MSISYWPGQEPAGFQAVLADGSRDPKVWRGCATAHALQGELAEAQFCLQMAMQLEILQGIERIARLAQGVISPGAA